MLQFSKWQIGGVALLIALAAYFLVPNFIAEDSDIPGVPNTRVTLGLDLQGGSYLLLEVDTEKVLADRLGATVDDIRATLRGRGESAKSRINFTDLRIKDDTVFVTIRKDEDLAEGKKRLQDMASTLGGQFSGLGRDLDVVDLGDKKFSIAQTDEAKSFYAAKAVSDSIEVVRRRIDALGTKEPSIQRQGTNRLVVQVPGDNDAEALKSVINRTGQLTFHMVDDTVSAAEAEAGLLPPSRLLLPMDDGTGRLVLFERPDITGDMIKSASATPNSDGGGFQVNFAFDQRGTRRFRDTTQQNIGRRFAIVLDEQIISAPTIQSAIIGGSGRITGRFSPEEANELAVLINSGALPAPLQTIEQRTVGPDLGQESVEKGTIAFGVGLIGVFIFMIITYGRFGIYADLALIANMVLLFGLLSVLGATLTLPGIAGIVLTIGMAVDANVLIFERIREENKSGKSSVAAVESGYRRAFSAIIDANVTTFIAAAIMFYLGSGPVRGFAVTLAIGVITSVFTAYVVTRVFAGGYVLKHRPKELTL